MLQTAEKVECRVALVDLPTEVAQMLRQIFGQFKIKAVEYLSPNSSNKARQRVVFPAPTSPVN
jgi:tryptophan synthase alpha subunit